MFREPPEARRGGKTAVERYRTWIGGLALVDRPSFARGLSRGLSRGQANFFIGRWPSRLDRPNQNLVLDRPNRGPPASPDRQAPPPSLLKHQGQRLRPKTSIWTSIWTGQLAWGEPNPLDGIPWTGQPGGLRFGPALVSRFGQANWLGVEIGPPAWTGQTEARPHHPTGRPRRHRSSSTKASDCVPRRPRPPATACS